MLWIKVRDQASNGWMIFACGCGLSCVDVACRYYVAVRAVSHNKGLRAFVSLSTNPTGVIEIFQSGDDRRDD